MTTSRSFLTTLFAALFCITTLPACGGSDPDEPGPTEGEAEAEAETEACEEICETWSRCKDEAGKELTMEWCLNHCNTQQDCNVNCSATNHACGSTMPSNLDCDSLCGNPGEGEAESESEAESEGEEDPCPNVCGTWDVCYGCEFGEGCGGLIIYDDGCLDDCQERGCGFTCWDLNNTCGMKMEIDCDALCGG